MAAILEEMPSDDIADLLGEMPQQQAGELLHLMEDEEAKEVRGLLQYPDDTAGGIMTTEFIALHEEDTAQTAIDTLRRLAPDAETAYYVYVVNRRNELVGVLSLRDLVISPPERPLREFMNTNVTSVAASMDQEEVARVVQKYDLLAVPVVDEFNRLLGIVTVDDVLDVIEEETTEDIYRLGSTGSPEPEEDLARPWARARKRLPWLVPLLFGEILSGRVIEGFSGMLQTFTVLAFFITVMAGESGNTATQSLAVVVRGIATGEIDGRKIWRVVWLEAQVGIMVGVITGLVLALTAVAWHKSAVVGLVVGAAMALNMIIAATLGGFFPLVIHRFGWDPAVASGPFITTLTDIISMAVYFGVATYVLRTLV